LYHGTIPDLSVEQLEQRIVAFVRAFGLHRPDETPCGAPLPVSEAHALAVLSGGGGQGGITQTELGRHLMLTKSTVSRLVDQLERRGWVPRQTSADDARRRLVELTSEGAKVARDVARRRGERLSQLLEHIPPADRPAVLAGARLAGGGGPCDVT
jgi:DNA-binding MarR family transcriptional regulator